MRQTDVIQAQETERRRLNWSAAAEDLLMEQCQINGFQTLEARFLDTNEAHKAHRRADAAQHESFQGVECQRRIDQEDEEGAAWCVGLWDIDAPLANPNVKREIIGRISETCTFCGARFWTREQTGGSTRRPVYSKCCVGRKVAISSIRTLPEFLAMMRD